MALKYARVVQGLNINSTYCGNVPDRSGTHLGLFEDSVALE